MGHANLKSPLVIATPTQVIVDHILQQAVVQFSATSDPVVLCIALHIFVVH